MATLSREKSSSIEAPGYLAYHRQVGYTIAVVGLIIFLLMGANLFLDGPLIPLDHSIINALHAQAEAGPGWMITVMKVGSSIGFFGIIGLSLFLGILYIVRRNWHALCLVLAGVVGGQLFFDVVAGVINRPRPNFTDPYEGLTAASFPSGHTVSSVIMAGFLLYYYLPRIRQRPIRIALIVLGVLIVSWVSYSRLYLGSHFPTDAVGGLGLGLAWGAATYTGVEVYWLRRWQRRNSEDVESHAGPGSGTEGVPLNRS